MNISSWLEVADSNRQKCSICGRTIPKFVERVSFGFSTQWGYSHKRICGLCILQLADNIDKKRINEWKDSLLVKKI